MEKLLKLFRIVSELAFISFARLRFGRAAFAERTRLAAGVKLQCVDGGRLVFGSCCYLSSGVQVIVKRGNLVVGDRAFVGVGSILVARHGIQIGNDALIGEYVSIRDQDHALDRVERAKGDFTSSPIVIGDNVWLGAKVTVIQGVTIGNNVVVGANSVVTHDLPDNCVAVGSPARVVRHLKAD